jgi:N-methylhydantoinase B
VAIDRITAEIIRNYLEAVSEEISKTMEMTAVSNVYNEAHDYSCGVFYYDGKDVSLLARAAAVPSHIWASIVSVQAIVDFFPGELYEGDILVLSDPYFGGSHIPDWTVMKPVFHRGTPVFFPGVRAHMLDVGGPAAGGYNILARDVWQEGFRLPPMKVFDRGQLRQDVWDLMMANTRIPDTITGDFNAMVGGCRVGERRILELVERYGMENVIESVDYILDYSEALVRKGISEWPDGTYTGESILDHDYAGTRNVPVRVAIRKQDTGVTVDFKGSAEQTPGFVNSTPGNSASHVYAQFAALFPDVPVNSGFFRPVTCIFPEGSVVNPLPPAPVGNSTVCIGADIGQAVMKALEKIVPTKAANGEVDLTILITMGEDRRYADPFFISIDYFASATCAGGAYGQDGWGTWSALFCALHLATIEMSEVQYPFLYRCAEYAIDTAAPGEWRGVPAFHMIRDHTEDFGGEGKVNVLVQMNAHPLQGYAGGSPGVGNHYVLDYGGDREFRVDEWVFEYPIGTGRTVFAQSQGGGGWGNPLDRDPHAVREDVLDEYVSVEGALRDYGVVIESESLELDLETTRRVREERRVTKEGGMPVAAS